MIPLISAETIAGLALLAGALCLLTFRKVPNMTRSSIVTMFQIGMAIIGPGCVVVGFVYAYFGIINPPEIIRQSMVRLFLSYLLCGINLWQIILLWKGKSL